nr:hypothetical protein [Tanacetum cinerariifolium]
MDRHGVNSHESLLVFGNRVTSSTRSLNSLVLRESLEIWDFHWWYISSIVVLQTMAIDFEIWTVSMRQFGSAVRINFGYGERAGPAGLEFSRKDLKLLVASSPSPCRLRNSHKLDLGARVAHLAVAYDDLLRSLVRNWHALEPRMLYVPILRKWVPRSLIIAFGVLNWENRDFKNFTTTLASLVGSAFGSTHFER